MAFSGLALLTMFVHSTVTQVLPGCGRNEDCSSETICQRGYCTNPCLTDACGQETTCAMKDHMIFCACKDGFAGSPLTGCHPQGDGKCKKRFVKFGDEPKSWELARDHCSSLNMKLATINNQEEQDLAFSLIKDKKSKPYWWIGGSDLESHDGTYKWSSTNNKLTYTNWSPPDPNQHKYGDGEIEHCMLISSHMGKWGDYVCSSPFPYICEI